jgi:hypothetical protein
MLRDLWSWYSYKQDLSQIRNIEGSKLVLALFVPITCAARSKLKSIKSITALILLWTHTTRERIQFTKEETFIRTRRNVWVSIVRVSQFRVYVERKSFCLQNTSGSIICTSGLPHDRPYVHWYCQRYAWLVLLYLKNLDPAHILWNFGGRCQVYM